MFRPTYLYIKTHRTTGLRYFGKTTKVDPYRYLGSGVGWTSHLKEHGTDIETEILGLFTDRDECKSTAVKFSIDNNIVESDQWANRVIETGLGSRCYDLSEPTYEFWLKTHNIKTMNTRILSLIINAVKDATTDKVDINETTHIETLSISPERYQALKDTIERELELPFEIVGTIGDMVKHYDAAYLSRFFGEIWKPNTDLYNYTGWTLADEINKEDPQNVLDVGCGYHPFKGRIKNLIGIDPFNNCADYMVDILDYKVKPESHDHIIALGSINFNSREDIEARFSHCVDLLQKGGKFYLRANPGITHKTGPYVDIFNWSFEVVNEFAEKYHLHLDTFKQDANGRLYFVYTKINYPT